MLRSIVAVLLMAPILGAAYGPLVRSKTGVPKTESECLARNGHWGDSRIPGNRYPRGCTLPTSDGGKACRNPEDCQGYCLVPNGPGEPAPTAQGTCSNRFPLMGCWRYLQDGQVIAVCLD